MPESTLGGKTFLPEKYVLKINKMPEVYIIIARKIFSRFFFFWGGGARVPQLPSPTPMVQFTFSCLILFRIRLKVSLTSRVLGRKKINLAHFC